MSKWVWAALVVTTILTAACGSGSSKPPMVPDQPGDPSVVGDAGTVPGSK